MNGPEDPSRTTPPISPPPTGAAAAPPRNPEKKGGAHRTGRNSQARIGGREEKPEEGHIQWEGRGRKRDFFLEKSRDAWYIKHIKEQSATRRVDQKCEKNHPVLGQSLGVVFSIPYAFLKYQNLPDNHKNYYFFHIKSHSVYSVNTFSLSVHHL